jgi:hypothetical protein
METLCIEPDLRWEISYKEPFNSKIREDLPSGEIFHTLKEAGCWSNDGAATKTQSGNTTHWATKCLGWWHSCLNPMFRSRLPIGFGRSIYTPPESHIRGGPLIGLFPELWTT